MAPPSSSYTHGPLHTHVPIPSHSPALPTVSAPSTRSATSPVRSHKTQHKMDFSTSALPSASSSRSGKPQANGSSRPKPLRDSSAEVLSDDSTSSSIYSSAAAQARRRSTTPQRPSFRSSLSKSPGPAPSGSDSQSPYNGLPTLPTIGDDDDDATDGFSTFSASPLHSPGLTGTARPPPPAGSTGSQSAIAVDALGRPVARKRRSSSIKRKPSPGVTPKSVVDWEIPRKTFHSSIGFLTLLLNYLNPPTVRPLLTFLSTGLASVLLADLLRLRFPSSFFAETWELYFGFLMRESERQKINGVVWYLVGVIFVLALYPRDVAVVSILTLSWSDTTASTLGRLWGRYTRPLPPHFPGLKFLPFAPRKSLAGFLAATFTGLLIGLGFWAKGSDGRWAVVDTYGWVGKGLTAAVVGVGGAIVEALDLGLDDNLTLPILSGAVVWLWLGVTNLIL